MSHSKLNSLNTAAETCAEAPRRGLMPRQAAFIMLLGVALGATGCMTTPEDGEHIGSFTNSVDFAGVSGYANEWVAVQAWNSDLLDWQTIGYALTDETAMPDSDGELFEWSVSLVVPEDHWIPWGFDLFQANVRAVVYDTGEICYASSGEPFAAIWANTPPPTIADEVGDLRTR